jgi:hypothetical protein
MLNNFFFENRAVCEIMWKKYCKDGQGTDDNMARAHYMLDTKGYIHTYLLTPWSRVLLEKLTGSAVVKKFPHFRNPKFPHSILKRPPPVPILSQLSSPHNSLPLPEDPS